MACIDREARCNPPSDEQMFRSVEELAEVGGVISLIWGVITTIIAIATFVALTDPEADAGFLELLRTVVSNNFLAVGIAVGTGVPTGRWITGGVAVGTTVGAGAGAGRRVAVGIAVAITAAAAGT